MKKILFLIIACLIFLALPMVSSLKIYSGYSENLWIEVLNSTGGQEVNADCRIVIINNTDNSTVVNNATMTQNNSDAFFYYLTSGSWSIGKYTATSWCNSSEVVVMEMEGIKEASGIIIAKFKANIPNYENKTITMVTANKNGMV